MGKERVKLKKEVYQLKESLLALKDLLLALMKRGSLILLRVWKTMKSIKENRIRVRKIRKNLKMRKGSKKNATLDTFKI